MPWFKICDGFAFHPKTVKAKNEAAGAFARMGAWSRQNKTDGFIPADVAMLIAARRAVITRLVDVEFLEPEGEGYRMHDFGVYNPPAEDDDERREEISGVRRAAGARGAASRWSKRDGKPDGKGDGKAVANARQDAGNGMAPIPVPIPNPEHTHEARERGPDAPEAQRLLAALQRFAVLADVATAEFAEVIEGRRMNSGRPVAELERAIADAAADTSPGETGDAKRKRVRSYCDHARPRTERQATRVDPFGAWGLQVFAEVYAASTRRRYGAYVPEPGDEARAGELVAHARSIVKPSPDDAADDDSVRELIRFWAREYLRDDGTKNFLLEQKHALRHLARGIPAYGVPGQKPKRATAPTPEDDVSPGSFVPAPPEIRAALARLGRTLPREDDNDAAPAAEVKP